MNTRTEGSLTAHRLVVAASVAATVLGILPSPTVAYEFRTRLVRRVGMTDIPIANDRLEILVPPGGDITARVRFQIGVFDDASGPAPAGGVIGWNVGSIGGFVPSSVFTLTRTPGRLAPFNFAQQAGANGLPLADPFTVLDSIDNTLGTQAPPWPAGSDPDAPPQPIIRGLNSFVSIYEISVRTSYHGYEFGRLDFHGNLIAATEWRAVGTPIPPTDEEAGQILYAPFPTTPAAFARTLYLQTFPDVPSPSSLAPLLLVAPLGARRRRAADAEPQSAPRRG